jgi:hypothetical protein
MEELDTFQLASPLARSVAAERGSPGHTPTRAPERRWLEMEQANLGTRFAYH